MANLHIHFKELPLALQIWEIEQRGSGIPKHNILEQKSLSTLKVRLLDVLIYHAHTHTRVLYVQLTCCQLHPSTHFVDSGCIAEEEEAEAEDAANYKEGRNAHKKHGCFKSTWRDGAKVQRAALADEFTSQGISNAIGVEAKITSLWSINAVSNPIGLDESYHHDHSKAEGEQCPQHSHGSSIPHVVGMIDLCRFLCWKHLCHGFTERWLCLARHALKFRIKQKTIAFSLQEL